MKIYIGLAVLLVATSGSGEHTGWGKEFQLEMDYPKGMTKEGKSRGEEEWGGLEGVGAEVSITDATAGILRRSGTETTRSNCFTAADPGQGQQGPTSKKPLVLTFQIIINNNSTLALAQEKNKTQNREDPCRKMNMEALRKLFEKCQETTKSTPRVPECSGGGGPLPGGLQGPGAAECAEGQKPTKSPLGRGKGAAGEAPPGSPIISYLRNLKTRLEMTSHSTPEDWSKPHRMVDGSDVIYLVKRTPHTLHK